MTILRPVTTKSPSSVEALEDSGLPFGFVLTPFALRSAVSQGNDDIFNQKRKVAKPSRSCDAFPTKASLIAKCTHCGSPLNPTCQILDCWRVLCTICGKTYGADFDSQRDARMQANGSFQPRKDDEDELLLRRRNGWQWCHQGAINKWPPLPHSSFDKGLEFLCYVCRLKTYR